MLSIRSLKDIGYDTHPKAEIPQLRSNAILPPQKTQTIGLTSVDFRCVRIGFDIHSFRTLETLIILYHSSELRDFAEKIRTYGIKTAKTTLFYWFRILEYKIVDMKSNLWCYQVNRAGDHWHSFVTLLGYSLYLCLFLPCKSCYTHCLLGPWELGCFQVYTILSSVLYNANSFSTPDT